MTTNLFDLDTSPRADTCDVLAAAGRHYCQRPPGHDGDHAAEHAAHGIGRWTTDQRDVVYACPACTADVRPARGGHLVHVDADDLATCPTRPRPATEPAPTVDELWSILGRKAPGR